MAQIRLGLGALVRSARAFAAGRRGDLVWNTLILVTVFLPLAGLAIDVPRYFMLRSRLQIATDAAAQAAVQQVDVAHFQNTGDVRLKPTYAGEAGWAFETAVAPLRDRGYTADLDGVQLDEANNAVTVNASGTIRLLYNLTPAVSVRATTTSAYRVTRR